MRVDPSILERDTTRILVVDDDPSDQDFVRRAFEDAATPVVFDAVADGEEAIRWVDAHGEDGPSPDVVILDLSMPLRSGIRVLERIRRAPALAATPVVVLSSSSAERDVRSSYAAGANAFVTKPMDVWQYLATVRSACEFVLGRRLARRKPAPSADASGWDPWRSSGRDAVVAPEGGAG